MEKPDICEDLLALRNFFSAKNSNEIKSAYLSLVKNDPKAPTVKDWKQIEFTYNRLFVGPQAPYAPLFASVYLDAEPQLMSKTTMNIREIYTMLGLEVPMKNQIPDDFISYELDAFYQISTVLNKVPSKELVAMHEYLMCEHLSIWLPSFIKKVREVDNVPDAILYVMQHLENFINKTGSSICTSTPNSIQTNEEI